MDVFDLWHRAQGFQQVLLLDPLHGLDADDGNQEEAEPLAVDLGPVAADDARPVRAGPPRSGHGRGRHRDPAEPAPAATAAWRGGAAGRSTGWLRRAHSRLAIVRPSALAACLLRCYRRRTLAFDGFRCRTPYGAPSPRPALDWPPMFATRWKTATSDAVNQILAVAGMPGMISFAGGLPDPATFPTAELPALVESVLAASIDALQYTPTPGLASTGLRCRPNRTTPGRPPRRGRADDHQRRGGGHRAGLSLVDPGDPIVVEGPSYIGGLRSIGGGRSGGDSNGRRRPRHRAPRRAAAMGGRPKAVYTIPDFHRSPAGVSLAVGAPRIGTCSSWPTATAFSSLMTSPPAICGSNRSRRPACGRLRPDLVLHGHVSKVFFRGAAGVGRRPH